MIKAKIIFLVYSLLGVFHLVFSQQVAPSDTAAFRSLLNMAAKNIGVDNVKAIETIDKIKSLVDSKKEATDSETSSLELIGDLHNTEGYLFYNQNKLNEAVQSFKKAQRYFKKTGLLKKQAECLNNSAVILNKMGNNIEAIENYHEAIKVYESLKDSTGLGFALNNISRVYRQQNDFSQALEYINESLAISRSLNDKKLESLALNSKAGLEKISGDTTQSLKTYEYALSLRKETSDSIGVASVLNNIGSIYKGRKNFDKALDYYNRALSIAQSTDYQMGIGHTNLNIGEILFQLGRVEQAENNAQLALSIGLNTSHLDLQLKAANLLMNIYSSTERWKDAFEMQEIVINAKEKIVNQETKQIAQREAMRYAFEKERAIDKKEEEQFMRLQQEKDRRDQINYIVIGLIVILLILLLLFVIQRLRSARIQNKLILKQSNERKLLLQEVHHRVKNNFQIVSSLLRLQSYSIDNEDLRASFDEAVSRINSMSVVHDIIYRQEKFSEIDAKDYLEKLIKTLQTTSGSQNVHISIQAKRPNLKIETLIHLGIALNELVINSFKYAFNDIDRPARINISLNALENKKFELLYQDNGVGLNPELDKSSFGMELIETLIEHLDGEVEISAQGEWNTSITLRFFDL